MEGPSHPDEQTQGMIPRALAQVFAAAQELTDKGWTVSFMFAQALLLPMKYVGVWIPRVKEILNS